MRIAILSDVHANLEALDAVEKALAPLRPDRVVCLGDVVGYGASPAECCARIRALCDVALLGNHDAAVSGRMDYRYYYDSARSALDWTGRQLANEQRAWLASLPYAHSTADAGFSHGSPLQPSDFAYIFAAEQVRELAPRFASLPRVTFVGHSHLCKVFSLDSGGRVQEIHGARVELGSDRKYIVSAGSVGQPRDYDNRACFVTFDVEDRVVQYHRVPYDIATSAQKIFAASLAPNFGKRLF